LKQFSRLFCSIFGATFISGIYVHKVISEFTLSFLNLDQLMNVYSFGNWDNYRLTIEAPIIATIAQIG
jgi:hypothetical protein